MKKGCLLELNLQVGESMRRNVSVWFDTGPNGTLTTCVFKGDSSLTNLKLHIFLPILNNSIFFVVAQNRRCNTICQFQFCSRGLALLCLCGSISKAFGRMTFSHQGSVKVKTTYHWYPSLCYFLWCILGINATIIHLRPSTFILLKRS